MNGPLLTLASAALFTVLVASPNERVGPRPRGAAEPVAQQDTGRKAAIKTTTSTCPPDKVCLNLVFHSDSGVVSGGGHYGVAQLSRRGPVLNVIQFTCQTPEGVIHVGAR